MTGVTKQTLSLLYLFIDEKRNYAHHVFAHLMCFGIQWANLTYKHGIYVHSLQLFTACTTQIRRRHSSFVVVISDILYACGTSETESNSFKKLSIIIIAKHNEKILKICREHAKSTWRLDSIKRGPISIVMTQQQEREHNIFSHPDEMDDSLC